MTTDLRDSGSGMDSSSERPASSADPAGRRALLVENDTADTPGLRQQMEQLGYEIVGQVADAGAAQDLFIRLQPDVVLIDTRFDSADGIELAERLLAIHRKPILISSATATDVLIDRAGKAGAFGYVLKPTSTEALAAQLGVALSRFAERERLLAENQHLTQSLENRKLIERAKGIFMRRLNLDEPEAHKRLQQESQKRRLGIVELARKVIESEELLGGE